MVALSKWQHDLLVENGSPFSTDEDHYPVVKFYLPGTRFIWLLTQIDAFDADRAMGLYDFGVGCPTFGIIQLSQLAAMHTAHGSYVQQDTEFTPKYPISIYERAAKAMHHITESDSMLTKIARFKPPKPDMR